jgi:hypothetical protein
MTHDASGGVFPINCIDFFLRKDHMENRLSMRHASWRNPGMYRGEGWSDCSKVGP